MAQQAIVFPEDVVNTLMYQTCESKQLTENYPLALRETGYATQIFNKPSAGCLRSKKQKISSNNLDREYI